MATSLERFTASRKNTDPPSANCALCAKPITNTQDGEVQETTDGPAHADCYYEALSDVVEKHPPGLPGRRA